MHAYSFFTVDLTATESDINKLTAFLSNKLDDQDCFDDFDFEGEGNKKLLNVSFEVEECYACVWLDDIEELAVRMVRLASDASFRLKGVVDSSESAGELMNFIIEYSNDKLTSRSSCWYIERGEGYYVLDSGDGPVVTEVPLDDPEEIDLDDYSDDDFEEDYDEEYDEQDEEKEAEASAFPASLTPSSWNAGDVVFHAAFGKGIILQVMPLGNDTMLKIAFDNVGMKMLMASTASAHLRKL